MMSFPRIQSLLSETEEDFMRLVQAHRDGRDRTYQYGVTRASLGLPGDAVRFCVATIDWMGTSPNDATRSHACRVRSTAAGRQSRRSGIRSSSPT
jgi:hypothetical protein